MFKTRLGIVTLLFGGCFFVVTCRLWQLQVMRYERYRALSSLSNQTEKMVPALRGPILDRYGNVLAEDRASYDVSVRVDRLKFRSFKMDEIKTARAFFKDDAKAREDAFDALAKDLEREPYVRDLADTLQRDAAEIAAGMLKAIDAVTRTPPWASPRTPIRIAGGVDEKTWLALRATHEDVFRDSFQALGGKLASATEIEEPPFPGLICTVSTKRVYPQGRLACFVIGAVGELNNDDEETLKRDGILLDNTAARSRYWVQLRDAMSDERADRLERVMRVHPQEIADLSELHAALSRLRPYELQQASALGLVEPVRWMDRPARMKLVEPEMLWMGIGGPRGSSQNNLPNRIIGELGAERWHNEWLRGKSGMKIRESLNGKDDESALTYRKDAQPREGSTLALTISLAWQSAVEKAMRSQEHRGAAVILDIKTGEVLAMASLPDFDPNIFSPPRDGQERQEKLRALLADEAKPLLNRALSEQYPLGSVMKSLIAAVALEKGLVSTTETFDCPGYIIEGGQRFRCDDSRAHGTVNLFKAIRCSCNVTFHQIGARIGVENLAPYARQILGRRSGIDLPGDITGIYPDREWRMKTFPNNPAARIWTRGNEFHLAIGQGQMACTVMQAAQMMAAIGNGGMVVTPRVWLDGPGAPARSLGISQGNLNIVKEGLDECVNVGRPGERGTAYSPFHEQGPELAVRVAGKTSTAEHRKGEKPHAWFAGYAPADNPQIAFAVMLEEAGHGGAVAAPVAYKFLKEVYGTRHAPVRNPGVTRE